MEHAMVSVPQAETIRPSSNGHHFASMAVHVLSNVCVFYVC